MEEHTIRPGDVAFGLAAVFLFGTFAATYGWHIDIAFLCLCMLAAGTIVYVPGMRSKRFFILVAAALFTFPLSVFYYHLRVPAKAESAAFPTAAAVNPVFTRAAAVFEGALPYRQASLLAGIVSGSTTVLAPDVKAAMSRSGTSYLIGMYGYKIYLLVGAVFEACKRFCPRRVAALLAMTAVALFVALANAPVSALRAGVMAGLAMLAEMSGRKFNARIALMYTALLMAVFDPAILGSGGFILSFMSLVGIYALAPALGTLLPAAAVGGNKDGFLSWRSHLTVTAAVNLAIMPVVCVTYGDFPAISFISNFLVAPPFGAVIGMGIALAVAGNLFAGAATIFAPVLNILLSYQLFIMDTFARAAWTIPAVFSSPFLLAAYYSALAWFAFRRVPAARPS
ncbi:MAG: ComEC/Rec2 family competence protein [Candidatus Pacebacteria bacterium]|nr:ComEC/Rec2 family competence protein [Candidatus Paceibacterota bacterium]